MNPVISIIIPIYNAEAYLQRCIDSILKQTFQNFEIILINDGSIDDSGNICNEYALKDKRIKVIHKINTGVSDTRNIGIEESKGDWISFIDADDWIDKNYLDTLLKYTTLTNIGICVCDCLATNGQKEVNSYIKIDKGTYTSIEYLNKLIVGKGVRYELWGKLFRKEFIYKIRLDTSLKIGEDYLMLVEFCYKNNCNIHVINDKLYNYYINPNSVMNTYNNREKDYLLLIEKFEAFFAKESNENIAHQLNIFKIKHLWAILERYNFRRGKLPKTYNQYIEDNLKIIKDEIKSSTFNILYIYCKNRYLGYFFWLINKVMEKLRK